MTTSIPTLTAHDGFTLPAIGFGTYKLNGTEGARTIAGAVDTGYRLLDSAVNYENEGAVGHAARNASVPRSEVIVTSKPPGRHHEYEAAPRTIEESVFRTGLDAIDLYLIHWPNPQQGTFVEAWRALVEARERGLVRAIGVSNFLPEHLEEIEKATGVRRWSTRSSRTRASPRRRRSRTTPSTGSSPRRGAPSAAAPNCRRIRRSPPSRRRTTSAPFRRSWPGTCPAA